MQRLNDRRVPDTIPPSSETAIESPPSNRPTEILLGNRSAAQNVLSRQRGTIEISRQRDATTPFLSAVNTILNAPETPSDERMIFRSAKNIVRSNPYGALMMLSEQLPNNPHAAYLIGILYVYADVNSDPREALDFALKYLESAVRYAKNPAIREFAKRESRLLESRTYFQEPSEEMRPESVYFPRNKNSIDGKKHCRSSGRLR